MHVRQIAVEGKRFTFLQIGELNILCDFAGIVVRDRAMHVHVPQMRYDMVDAVFLTHGNQVEVVALEAGGYRGIVYATSHIIDELSQRIGRFMSVRHRYRRQKTPAEVPPGLDAHEISEKTAKSFMRRLRAVPHNGLFFVGRHAVASIASGNGSRVMFVVENTLLMLSSIDRDAIDVSKNIFLQNFVFAQQVYVSFSGQKQKPVLHTLSYMWETIEKLLEKGGPVFCVIDFFSSFFSVHFLPVFLKHFIGTIDGLVVAGPIPDICRIKILGCRTNTGRGAAGSRSPERAADPDSGQSLRCDCESEKKNSSVVFYREISEYFFAVSVPPHHQKNIIVLADSEEMLYLSEASRDSFCEMLYIASEPSDRDIRAVHVDSGAAPKEAVLALFEKPREVGAAALSIAHGADAVCEASGPEGSFSCIVFDDRIVYLQPEEFS